VSPLVPNAVDVTGTVVAITGAGSGIGAATCRALAAAGATVYALDVQEESLRVIVEAVNASGGTAIAVDCDVSSPQSVEAAFSRIGSASGRIDALLCSAGTFPRVALFEMQPADVSRVMEINFCGSVLSVLQAVRYMSQGGRVVLMTSGAGALDVARHPFQRGFSLYGASKAALDRWAFGVADELADLGVTINVLCPGAVVRTPGIERLDLSEAAMSHAVSAEDVAPAAVALLISDTGQATAKWLRATEFGTTWGVGVGWAELNRKGR
jgi:NAD(P)-dependent dehydrogenase (short-subunit alcohol dehydrogenase family)